MSVAQHQELYKLQKKAGLIMVKKTQESRRSLEARVAALEAKTNNSSYQSLFTDVKIQSRVAAFEAQPNNSSYESLFTDDKSNANNRNNPALDRKGNGSRQSLETNDDQDQQQGTVSPVC